MEPHFRDMAPHFRELVEANVIFPIDKDVFDEFEKIYDSLPKLNGMGTKIDWSDIDNVMRFNLDGTSDEDICRFMSLMNISSFSEVIVIFSPNRPAYLGKLADIISNFDTIFTMPDPGFMLGVKTETKEVFFDSMVEFDGWKYLSGSPSPLNFTPKSARIFL